MQTASHCKNETVDGRKGHLLRCHIADHVNHILLRHPIEGIVIKRVCLLVRSFVSSLIGLPRSGSVVVGRRTSDRKIASSTPGRCIAG